MCRILVQWLNVLLFILLVSKIVAISISPHADRLSRQSNKANRRFFMPVLAASRPNPLPFTTKSYGAPKPPGLSVLDLTNGNPSRPPPHQSYVPLKPTLGFLPNHHQKQEIFLYRPASIVHDESPSAGSYGLPITAEHQTGGSGLLSQWSPYPTSIQYSTSNIKPDYGTLIGAQSRPSIQITTSNNNYPYHQTISNGAYHNSSHSSPFNMGSSTAPVFVFIPKLNGHDENSNRSLHLEPTSYKPTSAPRNPPLPFHNAIVTPEGTRPITHSVINKQQTKPSAESVLSTLKNSGNGHSQLLPKKSLNNSEYGTTSNPASNTWQTVHNSNSPSRWNLNKNFISDTSVQQSTVQSSFITTQETNWTNPLRQSAKAQPNSFQRGSNVPHRPDEIPIDRQKQNNSSELLKSNPNSFTSVELLPSASFLSQRNPWFNQIKGSTNDCGGPWMVLEGPSIEANKVQSVKPYFPRPSNTIFPYGRLTNDVLNKEKTQVQDSVNVFFQSQGDFASGQQSSFITFPPGFNELPESDSANEAFKSNHFLIFSTTPAYSDFNPTTSPPAVQWKKPNIISTSTVNTFSTGQQIVDNQLDPVGQLISNGFIVKNPADLSESIQSIASTENSVIISFKNNDNKDPPSIISVQEDSSTQSNASKLFPNDFRSPSPFLSDINGINVNNRHKEIDANFNFVIEEIIPPHITVSEKETQSKGNLLRQLRAANLRAITSLIEQADIVSLLQDKEYTLIAPSNSAINQMPTSTRQKWANQPESLRETLLYHIIPKHVSAFENEDIHETLLANSAALDLFEIGSSQISRPTRSHHLRINIYPSKNNLTTDFDVSEEAIITINGAKTLTTNLRIGNLMVHVIDRVLEPVAKVPQTILDILKNSGLEALRLSSALSTVLSDSAPLTVFVPTTDAFLRLSQDQQQLFLRNETALNNLLWYHIVNGTYYSEGLEDGQWLNTSRGVGRVQVSLVSQNKKNKLKRINEFANVIKSDISATNGVVHFIDRVLATVLL